MDEDGWDGWDGMGIENGNENGKRMRLGQGQVCSRSRRFACRECKDPKDSKANPSKSCVFLRFATSSFSHLYGECPGIEYAPSCS